MDTPQKSQTNPSTALASRSSRSKGSQKIDVRRTEQEKINQLYGIIKKQREVEYLDFNLMKIFDGKYISTFRYKNSDPDDIGIAYDDYGNVIAKGVIAKETAFYFSLEDAITPIEDLTKKGNVTLDTYLVDVNKINMKVISIEDGVSITKVNKKGTQNPIMTLDNEKIRDVQEDPDIIKVIKNSDTNEIIDKVQEGGDDFLWYVLIVTERDKKIKKYFQISSYKKKWKNYASIVSNHLDEEIVKIIRGASRLFREFKDDMNKMKENSELDSIMRKPNIIYPEFPSIFREFVNLLYEFCPELDKGIKLIEVMKTLYYICEIYRESKSDSKFTTIISALNIEKFLSDQNAQNSYIDYSRDYHNKKNRDLYEDAREAVKKDKGFLQLQNEIKKFIMKQLPSE